MFDFDGDSLELTMLNMWFICLLFSGQIQSLKFPYDGKEIEIKHEAFKFVVDGEDIELEFEPQELYKILLQALYALSQED